MAALLSLLAPDTPFAKKACKNGTKIPIFPANYERTERPVTSLRPIIFP